MGKKIDVFIKRPGEKPFHTAVSNTLENLQKHVEGPIEVLPLLKLTPMIVICNENGKIDGKSKYNCTIMGEHFFGTIIFAGADGEEFADVPLDWKPFKSLFSALFKEV